MLWGKRYGYVRLATTIGYKLRVLYGVYGWKEISDILKKAAVASYVKVDAWGDMAVSAVIEN